MRKDPISYSWKQLISAFFIKICIKRTPWKNFADFPFTCGILFALSIELYWTIIRITLWSP